MKNLKNKNFTPEQSDFSDSIHLTMALDYNLIAEIKNMLNSAWTISDFTYPSLTAFVSSALTYYVENKPELVAFDLSPKKRKENVTARLEPRLYDFYKTLPRGRKNLLVERILTSYLRKIKFSASAEN